MTVNTARRRPWKVNGSYPTKPCQVCRSDVEVTERARWERTKFCSKGCFYVGRELKNTFQPGHAPTYAGPIGGHSPEVRARLAVINRANAKRGPESPNWRGGKRTERRRAMGRFEYKEWRRAVFERDNYTCQICGVRGGTLHADHIKPWAMFPKLRYDVDNGRTLCVPCHRETPTWGSRTKALMRAGESDG